ncbi:MAG TPA: alpha-amylase, partial [Polyangiaceae bacterium]|nr:alpha-amylase [Polyangiaceae bacterium]
TERARIYADQLLPQERAIDLRLRRVTRRRIPVQRIRCHGDLHLGQVLYTGQDFVIIDLEGEPGRSIGQRRYKRGPLRDVMGMIRSFGYATENVLRSGRFRDADVERLRPWMDAWREHVTAAYLGAYLEAAGNAGFVPQNEADTELLLDFYELEKVIYEINYELNNRPAWTEIPLAGLLAAMAHPPAG